VTRKFCEGKEGVICNEWNPVFGADVTGKTAAATAASSVSASPEHFGQQSDHTGQSHQRENG